MSNVLSNEKRQQVLALGRLGWSLRRIEETVGVRRETAGKYLRKAGIPVRPRGKWGRAPPKAANEVHTDPGSKAAIEVHTDSEAETGSYSPRVSLCEPYRETIEADLRLGRNARVIWQDLVSFKGFEHSYSSVQRFVRKLQSTGESEAHPVITTAPGEEAQVDYGDGPMVRHAKTGKYRRTRLFVMTLGCSRKAVWLLTWKSSSKVWCELHERAFRRLGGTPKIMVLDNLKEGVIKPDVWDPTLNNLYADMLAHYGVVALPARVRHPNRKGKVESSVGHAKRTPLKGRRFESLEEAQAYLDHWAERWADTRIHGTTKRQVAAMFAEEKPHLKGLPPAPFRYYEFGVRTVHLDGAVEVARAYYSAPPGWVSKRVDVQWDDLHVRLINPRTGELLREHLRGRPGYQSRHRDDRPKKTPATTEQLLARSRRAGHSIGEVARHIHEQMGEVGVRRILGLLSLAKKHGLVVVDDACAAALELGVPRYRFVRRYLERKGAAQPTLKQVDPLIRQLTLYRDLVDQLASGETPTPPPPTGEQK